MYLKLAGIINKNYPDFAREEVQNEVGNEKILKLTNK